jgi:hypothetical protein
MFFHSERSLSWSKRNAQELTLAPSSRTTPIIVNHLLFACSPHCASPKKENKQVTTVINSIWHRYLFALFFFFTLRRFTRASSLDSIPAHTHTGTHAHRSDVGEKKSETCFHEKNLKDSLVSTLFFWHSTTTLTSSHTCARRVLVVIWCN